MIVVYFNNFSCHPFFYHITDNNKNKRGVLIGCRYFFLFVFFSEETH